jgi:SAM-dependent methyltransferase
VSGGASVAARGGPASRALQAWSRFWARVEGPELDARWWHSHYLSARVMPPAIAPLARRLRGRVLDVGAGTGYAGRLLDPSCTVYIPTDLPSGRDAGDPLVARGGERPRVHCSGYDLPFADGSVEGVTLLMVLEHLERPDRALAEAYRVLAPGGMILVSVPFAFPVHGYPHDFRRWTPRGIEAELTRAGFGLVETVQMGNAFSNVGLALNFLGRYYLPQRGRAAWALAAAAAPLRIAAQAAVNGAAVALGRLDTSRALPVAVAALAEKPRDTTQNATDR